MPKDIFYGNKSPLPKPKNFLREYRGKVDWNTPTYTGKIEVPILEQGLPTVQINPEIILTLVILLVLASIGFYRGEKHWNH